MDNDPYLPRCGICGNVMQLHDLRRSALEKGRKPPPEDIRFTIHCCGYTLLLSDNEEWFKTIEALRNYHGLT